MATRVTPSLEGLERRSLPGGFGPHQLRAAEGFDAARREYGAAAGGAGVTIAIVDAYNDPTIRRDLAAYDRRFGLPPADLSVTNLGAPGDTAGPSGWSVEIALDVETIHAVLPLARIDLVEAASDNLADLGPAEARAASLPGVVAISNSFGSADDPYDGPQNVQFEPPFGADPDIVYCAAAGDTSGPLSFPAAMPGVVAVGGTVLSRDAGGHRQRPWLGYTPGYTDPAKLGPDVRTVGGYPGSEVHGTSGFGRPTWTDVWGTSLSCPIFAAMIGAADGVRLARGGRPLGTAAVLAGLDGGIASADGIVAEFARTGTASA